MKRLLLLFLAAGLLAVESSATAQQSRQQRKRPRRARTAAPAGDSTYTFSTRNGRGRMGNPTSESTSTVGVMGEDTIRVNQKGATVNQNYNTGVPLPPSSGGSAR